MLLQVLQKLAESQIRYPTAEEAAVFAARIEKFSSGAVINVIAMMDGWLVETERPGDDATQRANFNGKDRRHGKKNLAVFLPDGTIADCILNKPGATHDASLASSLNLETRMRHLPPEYAVAGDTAFATSPRVVRPLSRSEQPTDLRALSEILGQMAALSGVRVAAEWGIGTITKVWRILHVPLPADDGNGVRETLEICCRLTNFRARTMKVSQLLNTYF